MADDDFVETAFVMYEAGSALLQVQSRSACYLLGYVAECTLKAAALAALTTASNHALSEKEAKACLRNFVSHELERLSVLHRLLVLTPSARARRIAPLERLVPTMSRRLPLSGGGDKFQEHWHPNHRYDGTRWDVPTSMVYAVEANRLLTLLAELRLDGVL